MKTGLRFLIVFLLFGFILPATYGQKGESGAQNITSVINTARYILFGGTYVLTSEPKVNGVQPVESAVFKLDTYTGKTWVLKVEKTVNGRIAYWIPVNETLNISPEKSGGDAKNKDSGQKNLPTFKTLDE